MTGTKGIRESLESKAFSGGIVLAGRQLLGIILGTVAVVFNTRLLGPQKYGQFAIVAGLMSYAANIGKLGIDVYLIRFQGNLEQRQISVTQCLYLLVGSLLFIAGMAMGPLAAFWYKDEALRNLFWGYSVVPPIILMSGVPIALLDRQLEFKKAAGIELMAQIVYLGVSVPIIWSTRSVWGMILGALGQAVLSLTMSMYITKITFRPRWDRNEVKTQLHYGLSYAASAWIWQLRELVNPLIVGKLLGAEAVAFVALAARMVSMIGFAKSAIWRVYMSLLARLVHETQQMREAIEDGLNYQVLIMGISVLGFLAIAPELIDYFIGPKWLPLLTVFPFIAAGQILNAGFSLHSSALYVMGKNNDVSIFHLVYLVLFVLSAWLFTLMFSNIIGYGLAEIAAFPSYFVIRNALFKRVFIIRERLLYFNIILILGSVILMASISLSPIWLRILSSCIIFTVLLLCIPQNRTITYQLINKYMRYSN